MGILTKLFLLTTALCTFIVAAILIGQMIFFKSFYVDKKTTELQLQMEAFQKNYLKNSRNHQELVKLKNQFYNDYNSWITVLDGNGNIKGETEFSIEIRTNPSEKSDLK
ncbi:hypothetical protein ACQYAD_08925 [Neobacillus sp. SM06]|uniref:hypothetical protein n=1 Tax=Neobacillus sp. SM06 TaxID=3422492 RepID=UPI003D2B76F6